MKRAAYLCLCLTATLLALYLSACTSARPATNRELADAGRERIDATLRHGSPAPNERAMLPRAVRPDSAAARPGILSGIGRIFSTPAGTAHRQAVRLARATGPRKLGKGAVYAPAARQVANAYKATAPVTAADTGAVVSNAAAGSQQQNVKGDGNTLTADKQDTTNEAPGVGATIARAITGPLGWVLGIAAAGAVGYLLYLVWAFIPRRNNDNSNQA